MDRDERDESLGEGLTPLEEGTSESTSPTADDPGGRLRLFTRRALIRAGWTIPMVAVLVPLTAEREARAAGFTNFGNH